MKTFSDSDFLRIARQCHENNRVYCESIGDYSQAHWNYASQWQRASALAGVKAHLESLNQHGIPLPSDAAHHAWYVQKLGDGWKYGEVKDAEAKTHPCMVAYQDLPALQKLKDHLFGAVVQAFWDAA